MQSSTRDAREAREARARLYSTTTNFADKKTTARTLLADLVGSSDGAKRAGAGIDGVTTHGTATAAVLTEWSLATLAWAGVSADIVDSKQNLKGTGSNQRDTKSGGGGGAFGSPAKKQKKNNNASVRPPRAVGVEAPDAEIVCCDGVLWSVLVTSLRFMDSQNSTNYKPNATAATHVLRAACVAFSQTSRNEKTLNLATETLGLFEHTLGSKFKPTPEQCLLAVKTSTHGARVTVHFNYFVRLMSRSITQNPRKLPPAIDDDTLDTLLERAAAEVGSINSSVNSSTPRTDALDFLQSVFLHPAYLDTVPTAFGEINKGKSKAKGKTKGSKKAEDAEDNSDDEDTRTPKTPPELVRVVARRILKAACEGVDCGTLAPWVFKSFVQETTRSTQTRGGVASSSGGSSIASTAKLLGPCRLLWDSLFAPISEAESLRTTGITTGTRHITSVASDLVKEMNKAGLYSQTAEGGGPAPKKNSKPPRDRLERYASAIFANESVSPESAAKALRSLVELDVRLVEPYLSNAIAKVWQASESNDVVSETIAEVVKAHADTRRLPEFLTAAGAAAAELNAASVGQEKGKGKRGGAVFSTEIVLAAAQEAGHRVPPGQIKDVVLAAREATNAAFSFANGTKKFKKYKLSRGTENGLEHSAVERVASMCGFIATLISSLPAPPGAALPSAANDALTGFAKDLVEVMRKWCVSVEARGGGDSSGKKEKSSKESKNKRKRDVSNGSDFSLDGFDVTEHDKIDAVRVGAALVAYAAVAAMLEVCHDGDDLHGRARVPYLDVDDDDSKNPSLSLAQVAAWVLQLSNDSVGSHKTGVGIAGACVHRLAQLAPAALPPPAGEGDAAAVEEAKSLVLVLTNDEVLNNESFSTVEEVLRSCEDVWTPFASAEGLAKWTRTRDAVMKETTYPNAPSLDEPEILAARVNTAAFDVLAAARDVLSKLDSKGKANKSVTRCELVINDTAKRLDGDRDASGKSSVAKFWQDVGDEKDEKMKKADKKRKANESSLHSALARLTQIPPCVAARVLDPCALVYVLAVADCVSFQTNGHSSTGVCSVSRSFAARVAERDASTVEEVLRSCEDVWTPFASAEGLAKWTRTRDAVMKETTYPNAPSLDEPEILAARVNTAAFDVLAAARDVLSKLDSKGKANKSVTRCELVINDTAKRLDGDRDASGKSSVAKFWQDVGDEKDEKMKKADKKRKANESSLHSALARLTQIPPCVAARVLDPCALVYVLAVADCVSFQTNGHSSTGVCSVSRSFAARVAERDASAAREITKFLPALLEASVGENVIDCDDTETDESLFTTSTIAVASLTHAALSQSTDEDAVRNVVAVVEPAVRRMVAETKAVAAQRTSSEAIANGTESKNSKSKGMVPRVVNKKRKAEITSSTGVQLSRLSARAASLAEAVLVAATNKVPTQTDESKFERTKDAIVGAVASKFRIETKPLRIAVGDAVALLHSANAFRDAVGVSLNLNRFTAETAASALAASGASSHVADLCARHCDGAVLDADPVDETAVRICVMVAVDVLAVSSRDTMVTSLSKLSDPSLKLASESVLVAAATAGARCVSLLDATGPSLEPDAHAALLATVAGAYDAAARRMSDESSTDASMLPAPSQKLKLALDFFLVTLLKGAGKRLLGAGYRAAVGTLRDVDGFYRRMSYETCMSNYPNRSYPEEFGSTSSLAAMPLIANAMAMPIWLLEFLCKGNNSASKSALNANAEILLNAIVAPARNACESMESVGDAFNNTSHGKHTDGESYRHAVGITHASIILTNLLVSKKGIGLSSRCVARIGQMPSTLVGVIANCQISQMRDASIFVFVPLCSVLTACLRFRKQELKRSTAIIVHACVSLLDVLRQWHTRRVRVLKETNQLESEISVIDSACKRCASSLVAVYEEAVRSGFGRYCAHLLSDAVTVTSGGDVGIGQVAMEALKPGVFALLDGVGDRELGQMHAAFGSAGGGARRVTLSNLIEEHKRSHKYDGKV